MTLSVNSHGKRQVLDITEDVQKHLKGNGVVNIFAKHTTAAITVADLDPGTDKDILDAFEVMTPKEQWRHPHDPPHFPDHLWSTIIGPSINIPYKEGKLILGGWQRIIFIELDGPRERQIEITNIQT
jgi:secondary thiamine-phosphate synthase enzyme